MTELRLHGLSYEERLRSADLTVHPGETVGLIGPNGSGKTTLLRCVYGTLAPTGGRATLDGDDLHALGPKARARRVATVPQDSATEFELTVRELVALGRSPHKRFWEGDTGDDLARVDAALARVGLTDLADR
ncbi:ABC transporter ATP-binding protein, partial [Streptomyces tanashiensis]